MKRISIAVLLAGFLGCAERHSNAPELVGTWQNTLLTLESADLPETDPGFEFFVATANSWERVMGTKPVRTTYFADGTFKGVYRNLKDSVFAISKGTWYTVGDSLYFFQWEPDTFAATYQFSVAQDTLTFRGIVDWERDGRKNDKYFGTQIKIVEGDSAAVKK